MPDYQIRAGQKYWRTIHSLPKTDGTFDSIMIDTYCVTDAFAVSCAPRVHAIKKLLCAGQRSKGDELQDLTEAMEALQRSIDIVRQKRAKENQEEKPSGEDSNKAAGPKVFDSRKVGPDHSSEDYI